MPNTATVTSVTSQIHTTQTQIDVQVKFINEMVRKMQKQILENTRSNLGI